MKKLVLLISFLLVNCSLFAQFSVNSSGNSNIPSGKSLYLGTFGDNSYRIRLYNSSAYSIMDYNPDLIFRSPTSSGSLATRVIFKANGYIGINTSSPSYPLDVNGNIRGTSFITASDKRLKTNVRPFVNAISKLNSLTSVKYNYRTDVKISRKSPIDGETIEEPVVDVKDNREKLGFIAQDVKEIFPELVYEDENGYLGVDYISLIPVLVEAIKEQQAMIEKISAQLK